VDRAGQVPANPHACGGTNVVHDDTRRAADGPRPVATTTTMYGGLGAGGPSLGFCADAVAGRTATCNDATGCVSADRAAGLAAGFTHPAGAVPVRGPPLNLEGPGIRRGSHNIGSHATPDHVMYRPASDGPRGPASAAAELRALLRATQEADDAGTVWALQQRIATLQARPGCPRRAA
jgi:hypothetical protein